MNPDMLRKIIDEIFAALELATAGRPLLHLVVGVLHALALNLVPSVLSSLKAKGVVPQ